MRDPRLTQHLKTILETGRAGKLGASGNEGCCTYTDHQGHFCAMGCLLTEEQLKSVIEAGWNTATGIQDLYDEDITIDGLTVEQAGTLQQLHDTYYTTKYEPELFLDLIELLVEVEGLSVFPYLEGDHKRERFEAVRF